MKQAAMQELQQIVLRHTTGTVTPTTVPGLTLYRSETARSTAIPLIYTPMVCVMAQGEKKVHLGGKIFRYTASNYLLSSVDLPVRGTVFRAAPGQPYLALSLALDTVLLSEIALTMSKPVHEAESTCGLAVGSLDEPLLNCFVRLLRLLDESEHIPHLAPLITREIFYRMLSGEHGAMLRQTCSGYGRAAQIAQAIRWIRSHYSEPFSAETLADVVHMSPASLNRHFRAVTAMSPLQYQKQVRLQEARRLLLAESHDAATTAFQVGYASPSQFSREYARTFGRPPMTDAARLRSGAGQIVVR
jgi:AraC-like DNA-binding protein